MRFNFNVFHITNSKNFNIAFIILLAIEISNKSTLIAAIIIALPLVSIISLTWIWLETKDIEKISDLSTQIFWFVIPGLPMFLLLPILLSKGRFLCFNGY